MSKPTFFASPAGFRRWLAAHHASAPEVIVGLYKKGSGKVNITWSQAVDEALCYGWIDGQGRSLGDDAWCIRFTPRRPGSIWSAINIAKVAALRAAGKMRPAGEAAFARRTEARSRVYAHEQPPARLTRAQRARLDAVPEAAAFFAAQTPGYRRLVTHWVRSAKREETRERRLATLVRDCAAGRKVAGLR